MTPDKARAIWAIYVWCRRTDELVDGPNAPRMTPAALDRWEERLAAVFAGRPYDVLDAALADTVARFPVDIVPFKDMVRKGGGERGWGIKLCFSLCRREGARMRKLLKTYQFLVSFGGFGDVPTKQTIESHADTHLPTTHNLSPQ
jgi:hypothetical protein